MIVLKFLNYQNVVMGLQPKTVCAMEPILVQQGKPVVQMEHALMHQIVSLTSCVLKDWDNLMELVHFMQKMIEQNVNNIVLTLSGVLVLTTNQIQRKILVVYIE